jgi:hypothetical protein
MLYNSIEDKQMDEIELAGMFVEYARLKKEIETIESKITEAVLEKQETVKIAGVTATYYKAGFETPDYQSLALESGMVDPSTIDKHSTTIVKTSWKDICEELGVEAKGSVEKPARVVVKAG